MKYEVELTYHASEERIDRLATIIEHLSVGKVILETSDPRYKGTIRCLTSTGIIFVKSRRDNRIITGYMANMDQLHAMYYSIGRRQIPPKIFNRVQKNNSLYNFLLEL